MFLVIEYAKVSKLGVLRVVKYQISKTFQGLRPYPPGGLTAPPATLVRIIIYNSGKKYNNHKWWEGEEMQIFGQNIYR